MRRWSAVGATAWSIGAAVGLAAGAAVVVPVQDWQESREAADIERRAAVFGHEDDVPPPGDAVRSLVEQDTLLALDPLLADRITEEERLRTEEILAGSPVPARIAYLRYPDTSDDGYTANGALPQWSTAVDEEGHYVVLWDSGSHDSGALGLEPHYLDDRTKGQPGPALERIASEMATWAAEPLPTEPAEPGRSDYWSGVGGGIAAGALMGAFGVVPVFLVLRWYVGSRRRKVA